jgi:hypothetical protein
MPIGHGSRTLQGNLSALRLRSYEDHLDWLENHVSPPALAREGLTLLLQFAAIVTAVYCLVSRLPAIPKK